MADYDYESNDDMYPGGKVRGRVHVPAPPTLDHKHRGIATTVVPINTELIYHDSTAHKAKQIEVMGSGENLLMHKMSGREHKFRGKGQPAKTVSHTLTTQEVASTSTSSHTGNSPVKKLGKACPQFGGGVQRVSPPVSPRAGHDRWREQQVQVFENTTSFIHKGLTQMPDQRFSKRMNVGGEIGVTSQSVVNSVRGGVGGGVAGTEEVSVIGFPGMSKVLIPKGGGKGRNQIPGTQPFDPLGNPRVGPDGRKAESVSPLDPSALNSKRAAIPLIPPYASN
eukprot:PhF_6_TR21056/c0_g1_i2/m.30317